MNIKLELTKKERDYLRTFKQSQGHSLREFNRATLLIFLDKGLTISEIENLLEVDRTTICRIRKRYFEHGVEMALTEGDRPGQPQKYSTLHEVELTALACGPAPEGRKRWTIRLLVSELHKQKGLECITYGSVRQLLKKTNLSLG
jgi:putative transposase